MRRGSLKGSIGAFAAENRCHVAPDTMCSASHTGYRAARDTTGITRYEIACARYVQDDAAAAIDPRDHMMERPNAPRCSPRAAQALRATVSTTGSTSLRWIGCNRICCRSIARTQERNMEERLKLLERALSQSAILAPGVQPLV